MENSRELYENLENYVKDIKTDKKPSEINSLEKNSFWLFCYAFY
jgi:hypothetical protein